MRVQPHIEGPDFAGRIRGGWSQSGQRQPPLPSLDPWPELAFETHRVDGRTGRVAATPRRCPSSVATARRRVGLRARRPARIAFLHERVGHERLDRIQGVHVRRAAGWHRAHPARRVRMKVVPGVADAKLKTQNVASLHRPRANTVADAGRDAVAGQEPGVGVLTYRARSTSVRLDWPFRSHDARQSREATASVGRLIPLPLLLPSPRALVPTI